jgi:hypothetical protein
MRQMCLAAVKPTADRREIVRQAISLIVNRMRLNLLGYSVTVAGLSQVCGAGSCDRGWWLLSQCAATNSWESAAGYWHKRSLYRKG